MTYAIENVAKIRVLIVDDHPILRIGARDFLEATSDIGVVDEAGDGREALEKIRRHRPDVVLLDIVMPGMSGLDAARRISKISPGTAIVIHTSFREQAYIQLALKAGALAYVLKSGAPEELPAAIRTVHAGRHFLNAFLTPALVAAGRKGRQAAPAGEAFSSLSPREQEVFLLLVEGFTTSQIAEILGVSAKTVEKHRSRIAGKIGIDNPVEMVKYAIRIGLVDPGLWKS